MFEALISAGAPAWLIVLLIVLGLVPAAGSEKAATLPGLLGAGARAWQGRKARKREEARAAAAEPTPSELLDDKVIARMDKRYDDLVEQCAADARRADERAERQDRAIADLRRDVENLEREVTETKARFFLLLGYTRRVILALRDLDPEHPLPAVPVELREWLGHG
ncbi:hypothetical protein ACLQ3K_22250 [Tsukamurella sp. DT100]|uniref:hypothetical protein n=1 Tax=Tsukamurella sp. DT100 TaxID=3393415 RepID=UPI003CF94AF3